MKCGGTNNKRGTNIKKGGTNMAHRMKFWHLRIGALPILLGVLAMGGLLLAAQAASAAIGGGNCMADRYFNATGGHLTCTANDVRIAKAGNIRGIDGNPLSSCVSGQTFSFIADFTVETTATARYDIGLYFATDGDLNKDGALSGTCDVNIITPKDPLTGLGSANFVQLDPAPDLCGDINTANNPQIVTVRVDNVMCQDSDGDGFLNLPNCTSWRQTGANDARRLASKAVSSITTRFAYIVLALGM